MYAPEARFKVDTPALLDAAAVVGATATHLGTAASGLHGVRSAAAGGPAQAAAASAAHSWLGFLARAELRLDGFAAALRQAAAAYAQCDAVASQRLCTAVRVRS